MFAGSMMTAEQTRKVALVRRAPSRHVFSSMSIPDADGSALSSDSRGPSGDPYATSPERSVANLGGGGGGSAALTGDSQSLHLGGPGGHAAGHIPEDEVAFFNPNTGELTARTGVVYRGQLGPPSLIEEDEASSQAHVEDDSPSPARTPAESSSQNCLPPQRPASPPGEHISRSPTRRSPRGALAAPVPTPTDARRAAGPIPEGVRQPSLSESPARVHQMGNGREPSYSGPPAGFAVGAPNGAPYAELPAVQAPSGRRSRHAVPPDPKLGRAPSQRTHSGNGSMAWGNGSQRSYSQYVDTASRGPSDPHSLPAGLPRQPSLDDHVRARCAVNLMLVSARQCEPLVCQFRCCSEQCRAWRACTTKPHP